MEETYDKFAEQFHNTRYSVWQCVREFLSTLPSHSLVCDWGCGNGKNMRYRDDLVFIGFDICRELLAYAGSNTIQANAIHPPLRQNIFDAVISIAVLHHVRDDNQRRIYIDSVIKALKPSGKALVTVWAEEQPKKDKWKHLGNNDYIISFQGHPRFYHLFPRDEVYSLFNSFNQVSIDSIYFQKDNWCIVFTKH